MAAKMAALTIMEQQQMNNFKIIHFYDHMTVSDALVKVTQRERVRVEHFYDITVPSYSMDDFKSHFRMNRDTVRETCILLQSTDEFSRPRGPDVDVEKNLLMFLWFIGNLESIRSMSDRFDVSKSTFHENIRRTSAGLTRVIPYVVKWPSNAHQVNETSRSFSERSQFQNVIGAIDGSHIPIKAPRHLPHAYFNRKKFYSIVLLASCNSKLEFNYLWTGNTGSTHDATVLRSSDLFNESDDRVPPGYYMLGDSAFPIMRWLITPFRDCGNLTRQQRRFNKLHSRCREVIERAFGMLKCRFRRLLRFEVSDMNLLIDCVFAACVLHNLCVRSDDECDLPNDGHGNNDDGGNMFAQDGHELQGIRIRQQIMQQLVNAE